MLLDWAPSSGRGEREDPSRERRGPSKTGRHRRTVPPRLGRSLGPQSRPATARQLLLPLLGHGPTTLRHPASLTSPPPTQRRFMMLFAKRRAADGQARLVLDAAAKIPNGNSSGHVAHHARRSGRRSGQFLAAPKYPDEFLSGSASAPPKRSSVRGRQPSSAWKAGVPDRAQRWRGFVP
jgi:hypothetical protein